MDAHRILWVVSTSNSSAVLGVFTDPLAVARYLTDKLSPHTRIVGSYIDGAGLRHVRHVSEEEYLATV
jgi:hypothetical protein